MQLEESAEIGRAAGLDVRIAASAAEVQPRRGDVVHLFNIQRCHDWGDLPERSRAAAARLLLTPLHHDLERYHKKGRRGLDGLVARAIPSADRFAGLRWGKPGVRERAAEVVGLVDRVLLAHGEEGAQLESAFGADLDGRTSVLPIAIPASVPPPPEHELPDLPEDFVLCVGRLEPLKDSEAVAGAAAELGLPLRFVGASAGARHAGYAWAIRGGESWLESLSYAAVRALHRRARVHVLASWTEVVGRVSLEAALEGAAVVASDVGFARHYLGAGSPGVFFFEPGDRAALAEALQRAWDGGRPGDGPTARRVAERFTWNRVGPLLLEAWAS